jgi:hypothetical protein
VIRIQLQPDEALQAQPSPAETLIVPVPPSLGKSLLMGVIE